jgi:hypothetical protein
LQSSPIIRGEPKGLTAKDSIEAKSDSKISGIQMDFFKVPESHNLTPLYTFHYTLSPLFRAHAKVSTLGSKAPTEIGTASQPKDSTKATTEATAEDGDETTDFFKVPQDRLPLSLIYVPLHFKSDFPSVRQSLKHGGKHHEGL